MDKFWSGIESHPNTIKFMRIVINLMVWLVAAFVVIFLLKLQGKVVDTGSVQGQLRVFFSTQSFLILFGSACVVLLFFFIVNHKFPNKKSNKNSISSIDLILEEIIGMLINLGSIWFVLNLVVSTQQYFVFICIIFYGIGWFLMSDKPILQT